MSVSWVLLAFAVGVAAVPVSPGGPAYSLTGQGEAATEGGGDAVIVEAGRVGSAFAATYLPPVIQIEVGDAVAWANVDLLPFVRHTATADDGSFDTGTIGVGGQSQPVVFDAPGTFTYFCAIHPQTMHGIVMVEEPER